MPTQRFIVNGQPITVDAPDDERLLWVLRDLLGITGPKYGCGLGACRSCTSHLNGEAFNPCVVPVGDLRPGDEVLTIEGLAATVDGDLHPVQQAWLDHDVAQCGFCQPGQIMAAVDLIQTANAEGRAITDDDLDTIRNVCRCGTYPRIRQAIVAAQDAVAAAGPMAAGRGRSADVVPAAAATGATLPATGAEIGLAAGAAAAATAVVIRSTTQT